MVKSISMNTPVIDFPQVGPQTKCFASTVEVESDGMVACVTPCNCVGCMPHWCCACAGHADISNIGLHVMEQAKNGLVARATETHGHKIKGCCCCLGAAQSEDIWFEQAGETLQGDLECKTEVFTIDFEVVRDCCVTDVGPVESDITKMERSINEWTQNGWALRTIFDSPSKMGMGCCTSKYGSEYVCAMYKSKAIHEGYQTGRRLATAVDVEGQTRPSQMFMGATPITRKFFLFWEEFVDPSLNVPHCAYITLASRIQYGGQECCACPEFQFDTKIMRDTWGMAGSAGWQVAEIFDTGRERQCGAYTMMSSAAFSARYKDSMMVFDAPMGAVGNAQQGLMNMGQMMGGFGPAGMPEMQPGMQQMGTQPGMQQVADRIFTPKCGPLSPGIPQQPIQQQNMQQQQMPTQGPFCTGCGQPMQGFFCSGCGQQKGSASQAPLTKC